LGLDHTQGRLNGKKIGSIWLDYEGTIEGSAKKGYPKQDLVNLFQDLDAYLADTWVLGLTVTTSGLKKGLTFEEVGAFMDQTINTDTAFHCDPQDPLSFSKPPVSSKKKTKSALSEEKYLYKSSGGAYMMYFESFECKRKEEGGGVENF